MKIIDHIKQKSPFYSLEFFPPREKENWPNFFAAVERLKRMDPLFASVTYGAGGGTQDNTLEITAGLAQRGLVPMAHLTCVGATGDSIRAFLNKLSGAGVTNILALRGDVPKGMEIRWEDCAFPYASDLVSFVRKQAPDFGIGVAAYPTPHPESASFAQDRKEAANKLQAGSDFAVTQLFFDHREYFEYVAQMKALGVDKPILPGVLPVPSFAALKRVLSLSGCNIPAKLYLALEEADSAGGPEAVKEAGIAFAVKQIRCLLDGGAPGIHLYTLNQADTCLRIAEEVGRL
ncbi:MAG: methylenetetrahydrofolate reductase [Desulfovibrio sp.]|jgi:methylenetetrahydrofolate reductase (NADPH)|nr:methylenetetrahydrofolate reductase [Desulfovibrio sp.]